MIKKITKITGKGISMRGNDIDTDRIIPARFLKEVTFKKLGQYLFYDERHDESGNQNDHPFNDEKRKGASVLIVNRNFGCGSSREHAPQSLMRWGIKAIIGESFGEIFAGNCTMIGVPVLRLDENEISGLMDFADSNPDAEIGIDIDEQRISYNNKEINADMEKSAQKALVEGHWDSTSMLVEGINLVKDKAAELPYINNFK